MFLIHGRRIYAWLFALLLLLFAGLSLRYQYLLLDYREWGDESETIVTAKMMAAGMRLYADIFNHHGPLTFLPGLVLEKLGDVGIAGHRAFIALLQVLAVLSITTSPALTHGAHRVMASVAAKTIILILLPEIYGHMYQYQTLAGILLVMILAQYTIPAILCPAALTASRVIPAAALIASLPFLAVTYLPIAGLLFIASLRQKNLRAAVIGASLGVLANVVFLGVYGSFAGFMAFHLYLNAKVLPFYSGLQPGMALIWNALSVATADFAHVLSLVAVLLSASMLARKDARFPWRTLLVLAGLCSLLMRGADVPGMPYFYAILPLIGLSLSAVDTKSPASRPLLLAFLLLCLAKVSLLLPGDQQKIESQPVPVQTAFSRLVADFTDEGDRIIAYSFMNIEYLVSHRLPASGHFFYLPWQEKYNEQPKFGIAIDACGQIRQAAPKVMYINKWKVWDRFPWDSYASCVQALIDSNYLQVPDRPFYVRKDLLRGFERYRVPGTRRLVASPALEKTRRIKLHIDKDLIAMSRDQALTAIEIRFGTHARINPGKARLMLEEAGGKRVSLEFSLAGLADNRYQRFDIPQGSYIAGDIQWRTGVGISTWESHDENGPDLTCVRYVFSDGSRGLTPGCPMF